MAITMLLNGQKMWTSCARYMTHIYLVARTDPAVPKQKGISEFVIDCTLPGITIRPIIDITGSEAWARSSSITYGSLKNT